MNLDDIIFGCMKCTCGAKCSVYQHHQETFRWAVMLIDLNNAKNYAANNPDPKALGEWLISLQNIRMKKQ